MQWSHMIIKEAEERLIFLHTCGQGYLYTNTESTSLFLLTQQAQNYLSGIKHPLPLSHSIYFTKFMQSATLSP